MPYKSKKNRDAYQRNRRAGRQAPLGVNRGGRPIKHTPDVLVGILNAMLKPYSGLDDAAKKHGISVPTIFAWQKLSAQHEADEVADSPFLISYLDNVSWFHRHMAFVRKCVVARIDHRILEAATSSHFEPLFNAQTGQPFWVVDAKAAADAKEHADDPEMFEMIWGRPITDIYKRDENGALIQAMREVEPNPQLLIKVASSLLNEVYGERVAHTLTIGGVVRVGPSMAPAPKQLAPSPTHQVLDADFTPVDEEQSEPTNILMVAEAPETVEEFEETFGGKRLVEAILFYAEDKTLLPPLADIVIVEGSSVHRAYQEAGIEVDAVPAGELIAQGYCNDFLLKLAGPAESALVKELRAKLKEPIQHRQPSHHVEVAGRDNDQPDDLPEKPLTRPLDQHPRAYWEPPLRKPRKAPGTGEAPHRIDSGEQVGYGKAPSGGFSIVR